MAKKKIKVNSVLPKAAEVPREIVKKSTLLFIILVVIFLVGIGGVIGWLIGQGNVKQTALDSLRIKDGYKYISPLLACDTETDLKSGKTRNLESKISNFVENEKSNGNLAAASVYIRDYNGGYVASYNPEEKYYPASLGKVPIMLTALKMASKEAGFLGKSYNFDDQRDYNQGLEILPSEYLKTGQQYTLNQALELMIENSDDNATNFLAKYLDQTTYKDIFSRLDIPFPENTQNFIDFRTAKDFSYFLRVLYNATLLDKAGSEKAMELLSKSDYKNGLVAGVPQGVTVAHKFGILTHSENYNFVDRQLHDCGMVYKAGTKPYLICIMTKSAAALEKQEGVIRSISKLAYDELRK